MHLMNTTGLIILEQQESGQKIDREFLRNMLLKGEGNLHHSLSLRLLLLPHHSPHTALSPQLALSFHPKIEQNVTAGYPHS